MKRDERISNLFENENFNKKLKTKQKSVKNRMKHQLEIINEFKSILNIKSNKDYYSPEGIYEDIKAHLLESIGISYMKRNIERTSPFQRKYEKLNYRDKNDYEKQASIGAYKICKAMDISDNYLDAILHYDLNKTNENSTPLTSEILDKYSKEFTKNDKISEKVDEYSSTIKNIDPEFPSSLNHYNL